MKFVETSIACALACLMTAGHARAENLRFDPTHPLPGQAFTIDFDYSTRCTGSLGEIVASLEPANADVDTVHIDVTTSIGCAAVTDTHRVHVTATQQGVSANTYPVYSSVGIADGLDPPLRIRTLEGTVSVGAAVVTAPVPMLSTTMLGLFAAAIASLAILVHRRRISAVAISAR